MKGTVSDQKALQVSETETRELPGVFPFFPAVDLPSMKSIILYKKVTAKKK